MVMVMMSTAAMMMMMMMMMPVAAMTMRKGRGRRMEREAGACDALHFTGVGFAIDLSWAALGLSGTRVTVALRLSGAVLRNLGLSWGIVGPSWCPPGCVG